MKRSYNNNEIHFFSFRKLKNVRDIRFKNIDVL